jgi:hypothetical protein
VREVHLRVNGLPLGVGARGRVVVARERRLLELGDDALRVLLAEEVGVDAVDDRRERHLRPLVGARARLAADAANALDVLELDRAAQREAVQELLLRSMGSNAGPSKSTRVHSMRRSRV